VAESKCRQTWVIDPSGSPNIYPPRTNATFRLRSVFALAMSEGVVDRNPAAALFTPRHYQEGRSREVLTPEQAATMIGALELREKVIVRLATWEGMRPGEILALQMGDLDDDSVWVRRRVYKGDIDEPKTKRSARRVALTVGTLALLDQWKLRLLGSPSETWIFGSEKGTPMRRDNIWRKSMYPKLKPVGLEWATFRSCGGRSQPYRRRPGWMLIPGRRRWAIRWM
jgi:integrase